LATAMCTLAEVRDSVEAIRSAGCEDIVLLHCTANYPAKLEDSNLRAMLTLKKEFDLPVGYSDHTPEPINPIAATALGAAVYEKHFTSDKSLPGPDHRGSITPPELGQLVKDIRNTEAALGTPEKRPLRSEEENRVKLRKSVVALKRIVKDQVIKREMLTVKRPATGIVPGDIDKVVGKKAKYDIEADSVIAWSALANG
jgi:N,N'-diacetyllegionaminate synthase